jgi:glutamyl-Q tRNA(Asp) synthetase
MQRSTYVGRFAPSPTGPLHYGSLVSALASYVDAKHHQGLWLLRIEDLDPPRESPEAPEQIKSQLLAFGLQWDQQETYQSERLATYEEELSHLKNIGAGFYCGCSRKSLPAIYPGRCRNITIEPDEPHATRLVVPNIQVEIDDLNLGRQTWDLKTEVGDFIIKRKDGLFAYQLAVVVDDIRQKITHVVRGVDLLDSTPKQIAIYRHLVQPQPQYLHIPVITGRDGHKLSKQAHARPVDTSDCLGLLRQAYSNLGQKEIHDANTVTEFLSACVKDWDRKRIPSTFKISAPVRAL